MEYSIETILEWSGRGERVHPDIVIQLCKKIRNLETNHALLLQVVRKERATLEYLKGQLDAVRRLSKTEEG